MTKRYENRSPVSSKEDTICVPVPIGSETSSSPPMDWLKARIRELEKNGAQLARALGVPKTRVYEMYKGKRRFSAKEVPIAARFLEMSLEELNALIGDQEIKPSATMLTPSEMQNRSKPLAPLIIWRSAQQTGSRYGGFLIVADKAGEITRPKALEFVKNPFAFRIIDETNVPVLRLWDVVTINTERPAVAGLDCVFLNDPEAEGGTLAVVGNLVEATTTHWIVKQYKDDNQLELPRTMFPRAYPIQTIERAT